MPTRHLVRGRRRQAARLYQMVNELLRATAPVFVLGSISFNHADALDDECLEHFVVLDGPDPDAERRLLVEPSGAG